MHPSTGESVTPFCPLCPLRRTETETCHGNAVRNAELRPAVAALRRVLHTESPSPPESLFGSPSVPFPFFTHTTMSRSCSYFFHLLLHPKESPLNELVQLSAGQAGQRRVSEAFGSLAGPRSTWPRRRSGPAFLSLFATFGFFRCPKTK